MYVNHILSGTGPALLTDTQTLKSAEPALLRHTKFSGRTLPCTFAYRAQ